MPLPPRDFSTIGPVAVSYDSVVILREFDATYGITYPLLADEGSHVIRALGLINPRVQCAGRAGVS